MTTEQIDYNAMPIRDRMKMVGDLYVKRDIGDEIHTCLDERREESLLLPEPEGVLIIGDTGTGKTSLLDNYRAKNPAERRDGIVCRPFLLTSIPAKASMNSLASTMLKDLGDPSPHSGNLAQKTDRVQTQLRLQQVEIVAFDEFQHMVEATGKDGLVRVSDWIKAQMKDVGIPFAICGLPHTGKILAVNRQLARLCPFHYSLGPFSWSEDTSRKDFRMFLGRLDKRLPFNQQSQMGDPDLAMRIFAATEGKLFRIAMLVRTAAFNAIRKGKDSVEMQHFAYAYETKVAAANGDRANPFTMDNKGVARELNQLLNRETKKSKKKAA
ncbi:MAG: TniB family NTP-binding protein [Candidatus Thiodiazotropha endolucinida]